MTGPGVDQVGGLVALDDHRLPQPLRGDLAGGFTGEHPGSLPSNQGADRVVTPVGLSHPHHQVGEGRRCAHVRSTVRSRKWVAQEMHGS